MFENFCMTKTVTRYIIPGLYSFPQIFLDNSVLSSGFEHGFGEYWDLLLLSVQGKFLFVFLNIFSVIGFSISGNSYPFFFVSSPLPSISITFLLSVWDDIFPFFPAMTKIISDLYLYSVPYSISSHVCSVLYCSNLFISAVLMSFGSKLVSLALQSLPSSVDVLSCLWALVLLDS